MTILIDTSVAAGELAGEVDEPWVLSVVTIAELEAGVLLARRSAVRAERLARLTAIIAQAPVVGIDRAAGTWFARLREKAAGRWPHNDLWIAATALAHDFTLLTADERQAALPLVRTRLVQ